MLTRYRYVVILILAVVSTGAISYGLTHRPARVIFTVFPPLPTPLPTLTPTAGPIRFHIVGAVKSPGVYTLPARAEVQDAIRAAGGPTDNADLERLNLAALIEDRQQIIVPRQQAVTLPGSSDAVTVPSADVVNINSADNETLQTLPGIGPVLAGRIIDHRNQHGPFSAVDDLIAVKGIGDATLEKLRPLITVAP